MPTLCEALTVTLDDVRRAQQRLRPHLRRTPLLPAAPLLEPVPGLAPGHLLLKHEYLQVTGAFKARGATNKVLSLPEGVAARGLVTASAGNHALGVAYAGWIAQVPTTVYLPTTAPASKSERLRRWGADVVLTGTVWDEADAAAREAAERHGWTYIHAFADPEVIAGQGTLALEILEDAPDLDVLVVAVGGGGLISGISLAVKELRPDIRVVGVEPVGAPTLSACLEAGEVIELPEVRTDAGTLAPRRSGQLNFELVRQHVDEIVLVSDEEMRHAACWLWFELAVASELSGAASVAALLSGKIQLPPGARVCALLCGCGTDGFPGGG